MKNEFRKVATKQNLLLYFYYVSINLNVLPSQNIVHIKNNINNKYNNKIISIFVLLKI